MANADRGSPKNNDRVAVTNEVQREPSSTPIRDATDFAAADPL